MVTCLPVASSDGTKKPITIIFKGKGKVKEDKDSLSQKDLIVLFSNNGLIQDDTSQSFLRMNFTSNEREVLIWELY